jgi:sarcosine oxidase, subunit gamma
MPEPIRRESPLGETRPWSDAAGLTLFERPFLGHLNLRGEPGSIAFREALLGTLGAPLPTAPNTFVEAGGVRSCWLGPNEWLLVCEGEKKAALLAALQSSLQGIFSALTDVSSAQTVLVLSGPRARDVLAQGCPLDLHPRAFGPGRCAQSYLARAGVLIAQTSTAPAFELVVRRSFAPYLWSRLIGDGPHFSHSHLHRSR